LVMSLAQPQTSRAESTDNQCLVQLPQPSKG